MTKKVGVWTLATLLIAGVSMGTYMYTSGDICASKSGSCPFTKTTSETSSFSHTTLTTATTDEKSSCCSNLESITTNQVDTSAYTLISTPGVEKTTVESGQTCGVKDTLTCTENTKVAQTQTIALAEK